MPQEETTLGAASPPIAALPTKLLNKNLVLLSQGQFVSQLGNQVHTIAAMFWIKHATDSATLMGTVMMLASLPGVLLGPFGGTFADRHSRRKIILITDFLSGLAVLSLAGMLFLFPDEIDLIVGAILAISILLGVLSCAFGPAISASLPDLVPKDKIPAANSIRQSLYQISSFFGQGAGGVLFRLLGAPVLFLIDGLSYIFSSFCCLFIDIPQVFPEKVKGFRAVSKQFKTDTIEGLRYVWKKKGMRNLFAVASLVNFFIAPIGALLPFYVEDHLHSTSDWFGYMLAILGVGALLGFVSAGAIKPSGRTRGILMMTSFSGAALALMILGFVKTPLMALVVMAILGYMMGILGVYNATILQLTTPSEIRGRVFGLLGTMAGGLAPLGMGLSGVVADLTGRNMPLIFGACGGLAFIMTVLVMFSREFREYVTFEPEKKEIPN